MAMKTVLLDNEDRVHVQLRTLVDLAKPAMTLTRQPSFKRAAQSGDYLSPFKGRGMAFDETRLYQPGDDVRRMDWRVTARTDKPHSKVFREERENPLFLCVDYGPTMAFATRGVFKSVQAAKLAALFAWSALQQGDRIGGQIFAAEGCLELKPRSGRGALLRFLNALVKPSYSSTNSHDLELALLRLLHHAHPGSRIVIISDFRGLNQEVENYLSLLARHCDVALIQVFDPLESHLPDKGRYRLTDAVRELFFDSSDLNRAKAYRQRFQLRQTQLRQLSLKLRLDCLFCSTQQSPLAVLTSTGMKSQAKTNG